MIFGRKTEFRCLSQGEGVSMGSRGILKKINGDVICAIQVEEPEEP